MAHNFPFVKIPRELSLVIGKATPGTRLFRREGSQKEISKWHDVMDRCIEGGCVSPGGVSMFVPVSRAAVHHRLKKGLLTAFSFYVTEDEKSFFGTTRKRKERPYVYIPVSECRAWAEELKRWKGVGYDPATEMDEEEGWQFVVKDPADRGRKGLVYGEPRMTREEIILEIQTELRFAAERILAKLLPGELGEKHRKRLSSSLSYNYKTKKFTWGSETKRERK
jgi:hypothetical protein